MRCGRITSLHEIYNLFINLLFQMMTSVFQPPAKTMELVKTILECSHVNVPGASLACAVKQVCIQFVGDVL